MSKNVLKLIIDLNDPAPLTEVQQARLAAVAALSDDQIDTSEAPFNLRSD